MNNIYYLKIFLIFSLLFISAESKGQLSDSARYDISIQPDVLLKRNSEIINKYSPFLTIGTGRFMPLYFANGVGSWNSPNIMYLKDDIAVDNFSLNLNSIDLVPIDMLNIKSIDIKNRPSIINGILAPDGIVNLLSDSISRVLKFSARIYTGSETGDPLIYNFTRENTGAVNKNKIVPSGIFTIENTLSNIAYRLSGGYFGYYNTGSINDPFITALSPYYVNKQNKQFNSSLILNYQLKNKRLVTLESSFISYYGWEILPFITSLTHSEFYLYNNKITFQNILPNININLIENTNYSKINKTNFIPESKFRIDKYTLFSNWTAFTTHEMLFSLQADIKLINLSNKNSHASSSIDFFQKNMKKFSYGIASSFIAQPLNCIDITSKIRVDRFYNNKFVPSGDIEILYKYSDYGALVIALSSIARFPSISEQYGKFKYNRYLNPNSIDTLLIQGNENINTQRNNYLGIKYRFNDKDNLYNFSTEYFIYLVENPIEQISTLKMFSIDPGDFVRNAIYNNTKKKKESGININGSLLLKEINISLFYRYLDNKKYSFSPKNSFKINSKYMILPRTFLSVDYYYMSKTYWEMFSSLDHTNSISNLSHISNFDVSIDHSLFNFYFLKELSFKIAIENLLDYQWQYIPIGNKIGRTVMVYLSLSK